MSSNSVTKPDFASRRGFLKRSAMATMVTASSGGALLSALSSTQALAGDHEQPASKPLDCLEKMASRRLHVVNEHTWEDLEVVYYTHGIYIDENLDHLNHLMRDRRANVSKPIDPNVYDQLFALWLKFDTKEPIHVLSGYRTPETNAKLRQRSSGVAKYSLHIEGRAADFYIPGVPAHQLQKAAIDLKAGGVGLYSKSNFVHVDTGGIRHWGS